MISWLSCEVLSRDLKDHMECKSTAIKLLRLKLTDVYFLVLITIIVWHVNAKRARSVSLNL